jgi:ubiquinone/menaquinone biosynthesis C-methylase UbiE
VSREIPWLGVSQPPILLGMVDAEIVAYYEHGLERDRLASGGRRIEFLRIWDLLERCLPAAPARVLDVGGGAGAYAIPLAAAGYEVHLIDPVPLHVEQAAAVSRDAGTPLASISAGDARDLAATGNSFDAVLLLGPLYHLTSRKDRLTALREARRVLRPGGIVVAKALSRFYPLFEDLAGDMPPETGLLDRTAQFLADGQYRNPGGDPASFTTSYFHRPEELADEIKHAGLDLRRLVAASGSVKLLPGLSRLLDVPESRDHVLSVLRLLETEPSLIGMSQNFVAIAQAPTGS